MLLSVIWIKIYFLLIYLVRGESPYISNSLLVPVAFAVIVFADIIHAINDDDDDRLSPNVREKRSL